LTAPVGAIGTSSLIGARCDGTPHPAFGRPLPRRGEVVGTKSRWQIDFKSRKGRSDPSPALGRALDARFSRSKRALRHPQSRAGEWLVTDGIDRHKAGHISDLRSSDLRSAHPQKSPRSRPSEMARKTSEKAANHCRPLPFLWNSHLKLCFGLAGQPSRFPNNAGSLPTRSHGEPFSCFSGRGTPRSLVVNSESRGRLTDCRTSPALASTARSVGWCLPIGSR
jgi:hypothetical protein